jgi:hypothetical protein
MASVVAERYITTGTNDQSLSLVQDDNRRSNPVHVQNPYGGQ